MHAKFQVNISEIKESDTTPPPSPLLKEKGWRERFKIDGNMNYFEICKVGHAHFIKRGKKFRMDGAWLLCGPLCGCLHGVITGIHEVEDGIKYMPVDHSMRKGWVHLI